MKTIYSQIERSTKLVALIQGRSMPVDKQKPGALLTGKKHSKWDRNGPRSPVSGKTVSAHLPHFPESICLREMMWKRQ